MHALTIHQPYAHLIATGRKTIETRGWLTRHRGQLAITASVRRADPDLCRRFGLDPAALDYGCVVAVTNVTDSRPLAAADRHAACCETAGVNGLILSNTQRLAAPVRCSGRQKLWRLPADVESAVLEQLEAPIAIAGSYSSVVS